MTIGACSTPVSLSKYFSASSSKPFLQHTPLVSYETGDMISHLWDRRNDWSVMRQATRSGSYETGNMIGQLWDRWHHWLVEQKSSERCKDRSYYWSMMRQVTWLVSYETGDMTGQLKYKSYDWSVWIHAISLASQETGQIIGLQSDWWNNGCKEYSIYFQNCENRPEL